MKPCLLTPTPAIASKMPPGSAMRIYDRDIRSPGSSRDRMIRSSPLTWTAANGKWIADESDCCQTVWECDGPTHRDGVVPQWDSRYVRRFVAWMKRAKSMMTGTVTARCESGPASRHLRDVRGQYYPHDALVEYGLQRLVNALPLR